MLCKFVSQRLIFGMIVVAWKETNYRNLNDGFGQLDGNNIFNLHLHKEGEPPSAYPL